MPEAGPELDSGSDCACAPFHPQPSHSASRHSKAGQQVAGPVRAFAGRFFFIMGCVSPNRERL
ncbi:hypothetical protein HFRIS_000515 [Herbaspirillum frisingense GSF30]|uniref:Uncharacterized protein n=1 Tax=Herbaspirillum frisingense GSF30 TaxID=864073 RepID=A0AAI9IIN8_9BURK|nr:hypothetical protein HFRIS_000515 [Herbaspirillum frisingense GSF30]